MRKSDHRFNTSVADILYNLSDTENNNHSITEEQVNYYRGLILATCSLIQAHYNQDWNFAMSLINELRPLNSDRVFNLSLPESWKS